MRYYALRIMSGEMLHTQLPLAGVRFSRKLNGGGSLRAYMDPAIGADMATKPHTDGLPVLTPWATWILAEDNAGTLQFGGPLVRPRRSGSRYTVECAGIKAWLDRQYWLGKPYRRRRADPLQVVRDLVDNAQSAPESDLGIVVDDVSSPLRVGRSRTLLNRNLETGTDHLGTTEGFTSTGATLSSVTGHHHSGDRALKCDMGGSHESGTEIFETHFAPIDPHVPYSFYAWGSTGDTEPQQSFEVGVTATFYDANHHQLGHYQSENNTILPAGGAWTEVSFPDFTSAWDETAYVRMSTWSADGDEDPMSVWIDGVMLVEGEGRGEDYTLAEWETPNIGREFRNLADMEPGFDWTEQISWADREAGTVELRIRLGYPRLGTRRHELTFDTAWNLAAGEAEISDGDEYANTIVGTGRGQGRDIVGPIVESVATSLIPRVMQTVTHKTVGREDQLRDLVRAQTSAHSVMSRIPRVAVRDTEHAPLGSWRMGDDLLVRVATDWGEARMWARLMEDQWRPDERHAVVLTLNPAASFHYGRP